MQCRRCFSFRLLQLDKKRPQDHDVFRCQECGFIFSPGAPPPGAGRYVETPTPSDRVSPAGPDGPGSPGETQR